MRQLPYTICFFVKLKIAHKVFICQHTAQPWPLCLMEHMKIISKVMIFFYVPSTNILFGGWREDVGTTEEQEVMGLREEQDREEGIKGMKQNSRGGVRSTCLGSHSKEVCQDLLIKRSKSWRHFSDFCVEIPGFILFQNQTWFLCFVKPIKKEKRKKNPSYLPSLIIGGLYVCKIFYKCFKISTGSRTITAGWF